MTTPSAETFLSVTELNSLASQMLGQQFGLVWIRAEIGAFTRAASGHVYLTLKDASSSVKAVMFRSRAAMCDFEPNPGDAVLVQARVGLYEPRGDFQLNVQVMRPDGRGSLYEQFQLLKAKLQAEGLFDQSHKRPVTPYPRAIGVVTSLAAAALHDVLTTLQRRAPHVPVIIYPSSVQGREAPLQLRQALARANERLEVDVLLLVRGGGSLEDLWAFNDEALARDIATSPLTVICGVGHESDVTIADFAADLRAPTPTAAAELACLSVQVMLSTVLETFSRLQRAIDRKFERWAQRLDQLAYSLVSPSQRLAVQAQMLLRLEQRLHKLRPDPGRLQSHLQNTSTALRHAMRGQLQQRAGRLELAQARLAALSPQATLERGFAIVRSDQGTVLRDAHAVADGSLIQVQLAVGELEAQVLKSRPG